MGKPSWRSPKEYRAIKRRNRKTAFIEFAFEGLSDLPQCIAATSWQTRARLVLFLFPINKVIIISEKYPFG
jgi:hypothetical protein